MEQTKPLLYQGKVGPFTFRDETLFVVIASVMMGGVFVVQGHDPASASNMFSMAGPLFFIGGAAIIAIPCSLIVLARRWLWRHRPL